jgi:hypothetical protein
MTNQYVERSFELQGPTGLGAEPRPELIGPVLAGLHDTLLDSVRMGFMHASRTRGRIPKALQAAADVRFVGIEGSNDDSTTLHFRVPRFGDVAEELFHQMQLWDDGPKPEETAFDLLIQSMQDVRDQAKDSSRFDHALLTRFASYRAPLRRGLNAIVVKGSEAGETRFDQALTEAAESLRRQTPPSRRVRLCGKLDMMGVSRKVMGLYLDDGTPVTALWNEDDFMGLSNFLGKDVTIEGLAMFRPSGKLLRIDADTIAAAEAKDAFFSKLPVAGLSSESATSSLPRRGQPTYANLLGLIPGDESEQEFIHALEETG